MANEIELKLCLTAQGMRHLRQNWLPRQSTEHVESQHLANTYFDTPELALNERRVALRLREKQGQYIQTLKTKGQSVGGLHQRGEWEWAVDEPRLYPELLAETAFPGEVAVENLKPLFRTDFERTAVLVRRQGTLIELAFDEGFVIAGDHRTSILEVELELKEGSLEALFDLAQELAEEVPLWLSDVSKAERGYRLGMGQETELRKGQEDVTPAPAARWALKLYRDWLRLMEAAREQPTFSSLFQVACQVAALSEAVKGLAQWLPDSSERQVLAEQLEQEVGWIGALLERVAASGPESALEAFEASHRAGWLSLQFSKQFAQIQ